LSKSSENKVLILKKEGLYCPAGDFYIDPRGQVKRALITHAHSDHARSGHDNYLCSDSCRPLLQVRVGQKNKIESVPFGKKQKIKDAIISFHPAGHILGSSQIRIEVRGRVWVVSGDYKPQADQTCEPFELVSCDGFISECTFGLPVYRWQPEEEIHNQINNWWAKNNISEHGSLIFAYSLGKAQRILAGLDPSNGPIYAHSAIHSFLEHYQRAGIDLPAVKKVDKEKDFSGAMIIAPPAVEDSSWTKKFKKTKRGFASGWMAIRGPRRRKNIDRGFILSDHADWPGLIDVITGTGAEVVKLTHGNGDALSRFLGERGVNASVLNESSFREEELD
jgi:putative mRNA 3-end processing factor